MCNIMPVTSRRLGAPENGQHMSDIQQRTNAELPAILLVMVAQLQHDLIAAHAQLIEIEGLAEVATKNRKLEALNLATRLSMIFSLARGGVLGVRKR